MSEPLTLDLVDRDGAIQEAFEEGMSRSALFRRAVVGGGTFLAGGLLVGGMPSVALGKPSAAQDAEILNFALLLEYLESEFYVDAVNKGALLASPRLLAFATTVRDHELAHVEFLKTALGSAAGAKPAFDFKGTTEDAGTFAATAIVLEDTGVAAYNGQGPRLLAKTLAAAATSGRSSAAEPTRPPPSSPALARNCARVSPATAAAVSRSAPSVSSRSMSMCTRISLR